MLAGKTRLTIENAWASRGTQAFLKALLKILRHSLRSHLKEKNSLLAVYNALTHGDISKR